VAVVSISRIQVRRGRKNQGEGLPQLASGELGWAIDSQELYIGNGAVSEGAPYVGNTRLLSENDNIFDYVSNYAYKKNNSFIQTGSSTDFPIYRSLQDRLDDRVSVRAFGALGIGGDETEELQRAIDQLFLNPATKGSTQSRIELFIEAGIYKLSNSLFIPPNSTIIGAGIDKTIFETIDDSFPAFVTIDESCDIGSYVPSQPVSYLSQPQNILLSNFTIKTVGSTALHLDSCRHSYFENIKVQGVWDFDNQSSPQAPAIILESFSSSVTCSYNYFKSIVINNYYSGIYSDHDIDNNNWDYCVFDTLDCGVMFGENITLGASGMQFGPSTNSISNSTFDRIRTNAIKITEGRNNFSSFNKFFSIGNDGGSSSNALYPVLSFLRESNTSSNDWFSRSSDLGYNPSYLLHIPYITEIDAPAITELNQTHVISINEYTEPVKLFRLPANNVTGYVIDYFYKSSVVNAYRSGVITLVSDPYNNTWSASEEYDFTGDSIYSENLTLFPQHFDENTNLIVDTIAIMIINLTNSDNAMFHYKVTIKS